MIFIITCSLVISLLYNPICLLMISSKFTSQSCAFLLPTITTTTTTTTCTHRMTSVHAEAELLLNLMASAPDGVFDSEEFQKLILPRSALARKTEPDTASSNDRPCIISPSFSFEAKRIVTDLHDSKGIASTSTSSSISTSTMNPNDDCLYETKGFSTTPMPMPTPECFSDDKNTFSISCPSLSLNNDSCVPPSSVNVSYDSSPSYLFSRPIRSEPVDIYAMDTSHIANDIAMNLVQSFKTAMEWRTKTWIKALTNVLSVRYQSQIEKVTEKNVNSPLHNKNVNAKHCKDSIKEEIKKSHEARVIRALSKAAANIVVHDVRTTFFVLEEQNLDASQGLVNNNGYNNDDHQKPPAKKIRQISRESMDSPHAFTRSPPYRQQPSDHLSHSVTLDAKCSVSTSPSNKITVSFRAPGVIRGKFVHDDKGNVHPQSVVVTLDTEALAVAMEENSRHVIRSATEEWMVSPPYNFCTIYDTVQTQDTVPISIGKVSSSSSSSDDSDGTPEPQEEEEEEEKYMPGSQRFFADRRYEPYFYSPTAGPTISCALVTPTVQNGLYEAVSTPYKMPLPPRSLPLEEDCDTNAAVRTSFLNPRRVSPSQNCASFVSPSPTKLSIAHATKGFTCSTGNKYPLAPSLVSPYNNQSGDDVSEDSNAPTIPALHEVACASHARCH
mmetsp:Transcript_10658/g.19904  ORF Transcript_10658/g.19904 Transcript_10658/m.19904 type:complete len:668 (+) Transcript_10658:105-2108(+)